MVRWERNENVGKRGEIYIEMSIAYSDRESSSHQAIIESVRRVWQSALVAGQSGGAKACHKAVSSYAHMTGEA